LVAFTSARIAPNRYTISRDTTRTRNERSGRAVLRGRTGIAASRAGHLFVEDYVYATGLREEYAIMAFYARDQARKNRGFEIGALLGRKVVEERADLSPSGLDGTRIGFSQQGLELREDLLDRVEVGRVTRQEEQFGAGSSDQLTDAWPL